MRLRSLSPPRCRDVSSVEVLMNYHQGLKTELEARVPELTACQELGRSLLLNKSAMADEVGEKHGVPLCSYLLPTPMPLSPHPHTPRSRRSWTSWEPGRRRFLRSGTVTGSGCSRVSKGLHTSASTAQGTNLCTSGQDQRVTSDMSMLCMSPLGAQNQTPGAGRVNEGAVLLLSSAPHVRVS